MKHTLMTLSMVLLGVTTISAAILVTRVYASAPSTQQHQDTESQIVRDSRGCEYTIFFVQFGSNRSAGTVHMPTCRNWKRHNPDYHGQNGSCYTGSGTP